MKEEKDALLAEFENPDMVQPEVPAEEVKEDVPTPTPEPTEAPEPVEAPAETPVETEAPAPEAEVEKTEEKKPVETNEPNLKKNVVFIFILFALLAAFIIFLPKILELLGQAY